MKLVRFLSVALLLLCMAACAGQGAGDNNPPDVQDINPGEKSVIQPPSGTSGNQTRLEERNI